MAIYANFITGGVNNHTTTSEEANSFATDFVGAGVVGITSNTSGVAPMTGNLAVNAQGTPDMTVAVTAGQAYVTATPSGQGSQKVRVYMSANENVTISANSSGSTKYDWVYLKVDAAKAAAPNLAGSDVASLVTSRSTSATTDDGTPPTYGIAIAVVTVANAASSITNGNIKDVRSQSLITYTSTNDTGWTTTRSAAALPTPNTVVYNGNRSYTLTFNSTDLTSYISNGMRLRTTRTVTAPTQCTSLNGTTQYYSRASASVAGMVFTDSFTISAWIKPSAYQVGSILTRRNAGISGFGLRLTADGRLEIYGGSGSTFDLGTTYQSVALNKWTHVAMTMVMSTNTITAYFDGVLVPSFYTNAAATSITQAGDLVIGSITGGASEIFAGKIAQVAVFSAVLSASTIRSYYSQGLAGTETSLISAYSFNGNANDLNTTNANNLTANGSAVATNADSPFATNSFGTETGSYDYGIVMSNTFSTNTTMVVQVSEGCTIPTSGGVSAIAYSTQKTPYGYTSDKKRWEIVYSCITIYAQTTPTASTWYNIVSAQLSVPIGEWELGYLVSAFIDRTAAGSLSCRAAISTSTSSTSDRDYYATQEVTNSTGANMLFNVTMNKTLTAQTVYYLIFSTPTSSVTNIYLAADRGPGFIKAIPANL